MVGKICATVSLAGLLLIPFRTAAAELSAFDQFSDAFGTGLFQGVQIGDELNAESGSSTGDIQGVNVIAGDYGMKAVQVAIVTTNVSLSLSRGEDVIQGINIYQGSADAITQIAVIDGSVLMTSDGSKGSIQGINVITDNL
jgi:hypothetical protein